MDVPIAMSFESFRSNNHPFQLVELKPVLYSAAFFYAIS